MSMRHHCVSVLALAAAAASATAGQSWAQEAAAERLLAIEEIVVSARRRDERLQDVPISVTNFGGTQLEKLGAADVTYLNQVVPNVTFERSRSTNSTLTAFIRGVGQQDPVAGFEGGVGIYIDDVYLNRPQGSVLDIYDVQRIEVLRGPQGTLYGRNTIGGAIKYVTKRLADEPGASVRIAGGTFTQFDGFASFGVPLAPDFKIGGSIARLTRDGFGDNLVQQGVENYDKDVLAGRLTLEWTPVQDLFLRVMGDWTDDESDPRQGHRLLPATIGGRFFPVLDNVFDTRANLDIPPPEVLNRGVSFLAEWRAGKRVTLKNILAYRDNKSNQQIDFDSLPVSDLESPFTLEDDQFSEEFQLLYSSDAVNGIAGFYYLDANAFNAFDVILGETGTLIGLEGLNAFTLGDVGTKTWSVFGDATIDLARLFGWSGPHLDALELSLGGRFTRDKRTARVLRQTLIGGNSSLFGGSAIVIATTSDFNGAETFDDFTPRVSLAWRPNADHNAYVSYAEGFKGGGFDPRGQTTAAPDLDRDGVGLRANGVRDPDDEFAFMSFEPEKIVTYEGGLKSTWGAGRARTALAVFYSDYKNVQIPGSIGVDSDGDGVADDFSGVTTNAGKARFVGVEFEGTALIADGLADAADRLSATWAVGYIDAKFKEFVIAVTDPATGQTALQNVADQRFVQNTPKWSANLTLTYARPLSLFGAAGEFSFINAVSYRSLTHQFEFASPIDQDGYVLYDASLVWDSDDGHWQAGIHGKNLTDKEYIVAGYDFVNIANPLGLSGVLTAFFGDPRTVTGTLAYRF
ncbi:MAG: TonB-dependent receptor [Alphaproteobacteria bacterium]|nr:MAG: TonB-dependent receptor [Alphaproteobacteria bacterium]